MMRRMRALMALAVVFLSLSSSIYALEYQFSFDETLDSTAQVRVHRIAERIIEITGSQEFQDYVVQNKYACYNQSNLPDGVNTKEDVLSHLKNVTIKMNLALLPASSNVMGSTSGQNVSINEYHFNNSTDAAIANTLLHEGLHTIGFGHCGLNNIRLFPWIKKSIPYRLGNFVEDNF